MKTELKSFRKKDAEELSKIISNCVDSSLDVDKKSKEFVKSKNTPKELIKKAKATKLILAWRKGKIIGCGGLKKNKIRTMFIEPKYQGKGIGKIIYNKLEKMAVKNKENKLFTCSSPNAIKFYKKLGFKKIKKDKFNNTLMEKKLK
jgi:citrate lyase synthetase